MARQLKYLYLLRNKIWAIWWRVYAHLPTKKRTYRWYVAVYRAAWCMLIFGFLAIHFEQDLFNLGIIASFVFYMNRIVGPWAGGKKENVYNKK